MRLKYFCDTTVRDGGLKRVSTHHQPLFGDVGGGAKPQTMSKITLYYSNYMCRIALDNSELFISFGGLCGSGGGGG